MSEKCHKRTLFSCALNKMRTRGSRIKPVGEILRFVEHQPFAEFHDAHHVWWYPVKVSSNSVTQRSPLPIIRRTVKRFLFGWTNSEAVLRSGHFRLTFSFRWPGAHFASGPALS
jgi:hypothetical protein